MEVQTEARLERLHCRWGAQVWFYERRVPERSTTGIIGRQEAALALLAFSSSAFPYVLAHLPVQRVLLLYRHLKLTVDVPIRHLGLRVSSRKPHTLIPDPDTADAWSPSEHPEGQDETRQREGQTRTEIKDCERYGPESPCHDRSCICPSSL